MGYVFFYTFFPQNIIHSISLHKLTVSHKRLRTIWFFKDCFNIFRVYMYEQDSGSNPRPQSHHLEIMVPLYVAPLLGLKANSTIFNRYRNGVCNLSNLITLVLSHFFTVGPNRHFMKLVHERASQSRLITIDL